MSDPSRIGRALLLSLLTLLILSFKSSAKEPIQVTVGKRTLTLSGPYTHQNLTVFLLHGKDQTRDSYLTLDEGLKKKIVSITEQKQQRVQALTIQNKSKQHLFVQEGERLSGGKQDRVVVTSLVIPPQSGPMSLPTLCIEQSRWREGNRGASFGYTRNPILASQSVRLAGKVIPNRRGQLAVWQSVKDLKSQAQQKIRAPSSNSSLNETLDSMQVRILCKLCSVHLCTILEKHKDAIGTAIAVNGAIEEVNLYPNADLLQKFFPRLVQSYAVQSALCKKEAKDKKTTEVTAQQVKQFMLEMKMKSMPRIDHIDRFNRLNVQKQKDNFRCITLFKGEPVHLQWINGKKLKEMPSSRGRSYRNNRKP